MLQSHFSLDISARYFEIAPRSRLSRHERVWCGEIALRSRRGVDISTRYFEISPRWWLSRRDLADLGAISARLPRSHRGLLFSARYFEISPRSWLSRRSRQDCRDLAEISVKFLQGFTFAAFGDCTFITIDDSMFGLPVFRAPSHCQFSSLFFVSLISLMHLKPF